MKTRTFLCMVCAVAAAITFVRCRSDSYAATNVTATTSLLGSIVETIGKDHITVTTIVPAGMCPGHFDISSQQIKTLADSKVIFSHGWEKWIDKLLAAADNKPILFSINETENVMVPPVHKQAAQQVAAVLCSLDRAHRTFYMKNLESYTSAIDSVTALMEEHRERFASVNVACAELQEEFLRWLGFTIVVTYGRAEDLAPNTLEQIITLSKQGGVVLVIDNMQSGTDGGTVISEQTNARHVVLTNFPLNESYTDAVMGNFKKLRDAIQ
ncbi:zinc ABC transporter substrate-binding protein [candidate division WOR-3 bacterium]|nr:zinc ABC transporter substrate-binding protein [candidate division WOR-3 bacterium]